MAQQEAHHDLGHPRTPAQYIRIAITGFFMGMAELIPGVSGGTIAFIMGIYETLLNTIKAVNGTAIKLLTSRKFGALAEHMNLRFLVALGVGTLAAFVLLSRFLKGMIDTQPTFLFAFFGGLVLGSIWLVGKKLPFNPVIVIAVIVGAVFAFWLVGLQDLTNVSHDPLTLFFSGMVAIMAMILPGVSGSYVLTVLGQYHHVLGAVADFTKNPGENIVILGSVALGCIVGLLSVARLISYALKNHTNITLAVLTGLMIGSLRTIVNNVTNGTVKTAETLGIAEFGAGQWVIVVACVVVGLALVITLERVSPKAED
jgi:putative membrane protein